MELENLTELVMVSVYGNPDLGELPPSLLDLPSSGYGLFDWKDE